jgi:hypothetical protein
MHRRILNKKSNESNCRLIRINRIRYQGVMDVAQFIILAVCAHAAFRLILLSIKDIAWMSTLANHRALIFHSSNNGIDDGAFYW